MCLLKSRFLGQHLLRRQYDSNIKHFDAVGPEVKDFGEIAQSATQFKVVQGHRF